MTYTPINWQTGDTITAEKLNKMDNGWGIDKTQLFSETVTTVAGDFGNTATLTYASMITAPMLYVTFDGTDYACNAISVGAGMLAYGGVAVSGPDFTEYPFAIMSANGTNTLYTETAGTHTVEANTASIEVSQEFDNVVNSCVDTSTMPMLCISGTTTMDEMFIAQGKNRIMYFIYNNEYYFITTLVEVGTKFTPTRTGLTVTFDSSDIFTVSQS